MEGLHPRQSQILTAFLLAGLALLLVACGAQDDDRAWAQITTTGVLRVGMDAGFPPFESLSPDGTLDGLDVALAREVGDRLGVTVQFVANLPYDGLYDALTARRVELIVSALAIDPRRMADFAYSAPYFDAGLVLVTGDGEDGQAIKGADDLAGCIVAVEFGSPGDLEARRRARRVRRLTILPCETADDALAAVAEGKADVALVDHVSALLGNIPDRHLRIVEPPVVSEPYAVATRRDSGRLLRAVNDTLAAMEADGTLDALRCRYLTP